MTLQPHILLDSSINTNLCILPGDPGRVDIIAEQLSDVRQLACNREYKSLIGNFNGKQILALSSGIGGPSTAIAIEELKECGIDTIIRVGSCGALQPGIKLGELIISAAAVRDDGTSRCYISSEYPAVPSFHLLQSILKASDEKAFPYHLGIIRSHDSYYADSHPQQIQFWNKAGVLGEDLESATLFTVGRLRGIRTASILNNVV